MGLLNLGNLSDFFELMVVSGGSARSSGMLNDTDSNGGAPANFGSLTDFLDFVDLVALDAFVDLLDFINDGDLTNIDGCVVGLFTISIFGTVLLLSHSVVAVDVDACCSPRLSLEFGALSFEAALLSDKSIAKEFD